jgi:rubredoxin
MFTNYYKIIIKNCFTSFNVAMNTEAPDPNKSSGDTGPMDSSVTEQQLVESEPLEPKMMDRYECDACGYIYEPVRGSGEAIPAGTMFETIDSSWRCPVCGAAKRQFRNIGPVGSPSGFKENLGYGLGVNTLTPGQKTVLIFGSLLLAFLFFMSLYGLK